MSISYAVFCLTADHPALHSFPTRRSSDLGERIRWDPGLPPLDHITVVVVMRRLDQFDDEPTVPQPTLTPTGPDAAILRCRLHPGKERRSARSEEHTSELQSHVNIVCRLLLDRRPPSSTLFPYTTLFRSRRANSMGSRTSTIGSHNRRRRNATA